MRGGLYEERSVGGEGGRVSRKRYFFSSPLPLTSSSVRTPLQVLYVSIFFYNCYCKLMARRAGPAPGL